MTPVSRTVSLCLVFIVMVVSFSVYTKLQTPQLSEEELREAGVFILPRPRDLAGFNLVDHLGKPYNNEALVGRWSFIFFGFTHCPDICPTTMSEMAKAERALSQGAERDAGFQGVLVTVDPLRDSPEVMGEYVQAFSPRFLGVRADREATALFAQQVNAAFGKVPSDDEDGYTMDHTGNIVIINPKGHYHGFIKSPHKAQTIQLTYQSLAASF